MKLSQLSKKLSLALITISIVQVPARASNSVKGEASGWERFVIMGSISGAVVVGTTALGYLWYLYNTPGNILSQEILNEAQDIIATVEDKLAPEVTQNQPEASAQTATLADTPTSEKSGAGNSAAAHGCADRVERHMHEHQKQAEKTLKSIEQRCKQMYDDNEGNTY